MEPSLNEHIIYILSNDKLTISQKGMIHVEDTTESDRGLQVISLIQNLESEWSQDRRELFDSDNETKTTCTVGINELSQGWWYHYLMCPPLGPRQIGPRTVRPGGQTVHFFRADSWLWTTGHQGPTVCGPLAYFKPTISGRGLIWIHVEDKEPHRRLQVCF